MIENLRHREKTPRAPGKKPDGRTSEQIVNPELPKLLSQPADKSRPGPWENNLPTAPANFPGQASCPRKPANWPSRKSPPSDSNKTGVPSREVSRTDRKTNLLTRILLSETKRRKTRTNKLKPRLKRNPCKKGYWNPYRRSKKKLCKQATGKIKPSDHRTLNDIREKIIGTRQGKQTNRLQAKEQTDQNDLLREGAHKRRK